MPRRWNLEARLLERLAQRRNWLRCRCPHVNIRMRWTRLSVSLSKDFPANVAYLMRLPKTKFFARWHAPSLSRVVALPIRFCLPWLYDTLLAEHGRHRQTKIFSRQEPPTDSYQSVLTIKVHFLSERFFLMFKCSFTRSTKPKLGIR